MPSFDVVCEPDMVEVKNALEQSNKEITNRFDFKGSDARVELKDGYFVTSDLGKIEDGKLIVLGRADDVINSGGKKVSLSKVEKALGESFAAFGTENSEWGTALNIATTSEISDDEIQLVLSVKFGVKALQIHRINEIPRTALEKIDRQVLGKLAK